MTPGEVGKDLKAKGFVCVTRSQDEPRTYLEWTFNDIRCYEDTTL